MDINLKPIAFEKRTSMLNNREHLTRRLSKIDNKKTLHFSTPRSPRSQFKDSKPYIAFTTPRVLESSYLTESIEKLHRDLNKSRLEEVRFNKMMISRVNTWKYIKSIQREELVRRSEQRRETKNLTPDAKEEYHSDVEDFNYSYLNQIGKVRRSKKLVINISKRPDYLAPSGYLSIQPHSSYKTFNYKRGENRNERLKECLSTKKTLASKKVPVYINDLESSFFDISYKDFPAGGEKLLKL